MIIPFFWPLIPVFTMWLISKSISFFSGRGEDVPLQIIWESGHSFVVIIPVVLAIGISMIWLRWLIMDMNRKVKALKLLQGVDEVRYHR